MPYEHGECMSSKIELWDNNNNYIYGELKGTKFELWDHKNNYIYGDLKSNNKVELWDHNNNIFMVNSKAPSLSYGISKIIIYTVISSKTPKYLS